MRRHLPSLVSVIAVLVAATFGSAPADAQARVEVGVLRCIIAGGVGLIVGSRKDMNCRFLRRGADESYRGSVTKIGLDIGLTRRSEVVWAVFAPTANIPPASLAGRYAGVSAEATIGLGVGANALIGGSRRSIILQPLSVQGQTGLNIAAGVTGMTLRAVGF
jgi:hypothetical protein